MQYAPYGNQGGPLPGDQQNAYAYQQGGYSHESTVEGQQYPGKRSLIEQSTTIHMTLYPLDQQGFDPQGQQGNGFVQNVQYQTIPQYGN